jgi:hypothetical protein
MDWLTNSSMTLLRTTSFSCPNKKNHNLKSSRFLNPKLSPTQTKVALVTNMKNKKSSKPLKNSSNANLWKKRTNTRRLPVKTIRDAIATNQNAKKTTASVTKWETHVRRIVNALDAKIM